MPERIDPLEHPHIRRCKERAEWALEKLRETTASLTGIMPVFLLDLSGEVDVLPIPEDALDNWNHHSVRETYRSTLRQTIKKTGLPPDAIVIEIQEAWAMLFSDSKLKEAGLTMDTARNFSTSQLVERGLGERVEAAFINAQNQYGGYVFSIRLERTGEHIALTDTLFENAYYQGEMEPSYFRDNVKVKPPGQTVPVT